MGDLPTNFIDLYLYQAGKSETPEQWYRWAAVSVIAGAMGDRIFLEKSGDDWDVLTPKLYVWLIGSAGSGKGKVIEAAGHYFLQTPAGQIGFKHTVGLESERLTGPALWDRLGQLAESRNKVPIPFNPGKFDWYFKRSRMYLITAEMGQGVHQGEHGYSFCMNMIDMWDDKLLTSGDNTRHRGSMKFEGISMNWFAGSTKKGIRETFPKAAGLTGFFSRVIPVWGVRSREKLYPERERPLDFKVVRAALQKRLYRYHQVDLRGIHTTHGSRTPLTLSPETRELKNSKYLEYRSENMSEDEEPYYNRWEDIVLKLSMVMMIAEWDGRGACPTIMHTGHFLQALDLWTSIRPGYTQLLHLMQSTDYNEEETKVLQTIMTAKEREDDHWKYLPMTHEYLWEKRLSKMRIAVLCEALMSLKHKGLIEWINPATGFKQERAEMYKYIGEDKKEEEE